MSRRRPIGAMLRGWTRGLPPLAACFGLMFLFVWLEVQRLDNEYRAQDLAEDIKNVKASIEKLREERHRLNRMERLEQEAPDLFLREADPGQIVFVTGEVRRETSVSARTRVAERRTGPLTRSVVFRLGALDGASAVRTPQHEVARMGSNQSPPG